MHVRVCCLIKINQQKKGVESFPVRKYYLSLKRNFIIGTVIEGNITANFIKVRINVCVGGCWVRRGDIICHGLIFHTMSKRSYSNNKEDYWKFDFVDFSCRIATLLQANIIHWKFKGCPSLSCSEVPVLKFTSVQNARVSGNRGVVIWLWKYNICWYLLLSKYCQKFEERDSLIQRRVW